MKICGWLENWTRQGWADLKLETWIAHFEYGRHGKPQVQFDRVVVVPFDEAVKLGLVVDDKEETPNPSLDGREDRT